MNHFCTTRPGKQTATPEVICTSRLLDSIGSKEEWQRQSGYSMENAGIGACKELVDNGLDACEETGIAPVISVILDDTGLAVQDNGPGIDPRTIEAMLDFSIRPSSRAGRCSPTRGQQGNGGQAMLALAYLLGGHTEISSHGVTHKIEIVLDRIAQRPVISAIPRESNVQIGTFWHLCIDPATMISGDDEKSRFVRFAQNFAWCNPHLTLEINAFGEHFVIPATNPKWRKFRPSDAVPPQWYGQTDFNNRIMALLSKDSAEGNDRPISDFIGEFRGLKRRAVVSEVLAATGLYRQGLSSLLNGHELNGHATQLYQKILSHGNPLPSAWHLGLIGKNHIAAKMDEVGCDMNTFVYRKSEKYADDDGKPFVVEMAFAEAIDDIEPVLVNAVNWSTTVVDPFDEFYPHRMSISVGSPVVLFVHLATPGIQSTDRGKAHMVVNEPIQEVMDDLLTKVAGNWHRAILRNRRAQESDERAQQRMRREEPKQRQKAEQRTLKRLVYDVLPGAIENYRGQMGGVIWERKLY